MKRSLASIRPMAGRLLVRALLLVIVLFAVFAAVNALPGDAARTSLERGASDQDVIAAQHRLGLDRPLAVRFVSWLVRFAQGDFGRSAQGRSVSALLADRLPVTLLTAGTALVLTTALSLLVGSWWMRYPERFAARAWSGVSSVLIAVPEFVVGTALVIIFALLLAALPAVTIAGPDGRPAAVDMYLLPIATLVLPQLAWNARIVRAAFADAAILTHVRAARLAGVSDRALLWRHIFPCAAPAIVSSLVTTCGMTVAGAVSVETLFHHPGVGSLIAESVQSRDVPVLAAVLTLTGALLLVLLTTADIVRSSLTVRA